MCLFCVCVLVDYVFFFNDVVCGLVGLGLFRPDPEFAMRPVWRWTGPVIVAVAFTGCFWVVDGSVFCRWQYPVPYYAVRLWSSRVLVESPGWMGRVWDLWSVVYSRFHLLDPQLCTTMCPYWLVALHKVRCGGVWDWSWAPSILGVGDMPLCPLSGILSALLFDFGMSYWSSRCWFSVPWFVAFAVLPVRL